MKRVYLILLISICSFAISFAQSTMKYTVFFTDKNNSPYSVSAPSAFLGAKSIQRRAAQGIAIQQNDLPPNPSYIQQVLNTGSTLLHRSRWMNAATVIVPDSNALSAIQSLPFVLKTEKVKRINRALPDEYIVSQNITPSLSKQTQLKLSTDAYSYGQSYTQVQQLGGVCMHNLGYDGRNMLIAVLDAGFQNVNTLSCFDSLWLNNQILGTWDFVANEASVAEDNSHGTMVLSCMGANLPGQLVGTAPKANYWLLRTEDVGSELVIEEYNWLAGAEFADSVGADIINSSLGYTAFDVTSTSHTWADLDGNTAVATVAADIAASKGILVCNSAGNEGNSWWKYISVPSDGDSVCCVAAVNAAGARASFSSVGPSADGRIKPDVAAMGDGTSVISPSSGQVIQSGGTSFSCPLTSGMAACLWQANPGKTNMQILNAMRAAGNQALSPDTLLGWGVPNYCTANAQLNGSIGISEKEQDNLLNVFYDPATSSFGIYFFAKTEDEVLVSVYDLSGRKLLAEKRNVINNSINFYRVLDAHSLARGIYLISISAHDKLHTRKVMKY